MVRVLVLGRCVMSHAHVYTPLRVKRTDEGQIEQKEELCSGLSRYTRPIAEKPPEGSEHNLLLLRSPFQEQLPRLQDCLCAVQSGLG